jgi:probable HAF family extracellular repeat protein
MRICNPGRALISLVVFGAVSAGASRADVTYTVTDLGPESLQAGIPEIPHIPQFDATGQVTYHGAGYYTGPTIQSNEPGFTYQPVDAIRTDSAGNYCTGWVYRPNGSLQAFVSDGTTAHTFGGGPAPASSGDPPPVSMPYGVNAHGQVVGLSSFGPDGRSAFLYSGGPRMDELGTLGGPSSVAYGINDLGQVVGRSDVAGGTTHAFLHAAGGMSDLNNMVDPTSGWTFTAATDINDAGQILGFGAGPAGPGHLFLLTPSVPHPAASDLAVPEPASLAHWVFVGLAVVLHRGRRWMRS